MASWSSADYPPPKPDEMLTDEYVESWFGDGLCGVLVGLRTIALIAGIGYLISVF